MIVLALFSGNLPLNVHGMGLVALTQSVWFVSVGCLLTCSVGAEDHQDRFGVVGENERLKVEAS